MRSPNDMTASEVAGVRRLLENNPGWRPRDVGNYLERIMDLEDDERMRLERVARLILNREEHFLRIIPD